MYDILLINCTIITCNNEDEIINDGCIGINSDYISFVGVMSEKIRSENHNQLIDLKGGLVCPGLIDAHFHTAQQLMRGLVHYNKPLTEPVWKNYLIPFESSLSEDDVYLSSLLAYVSLLKNGTTCFADAGGPHADIMGIAAIETGIRGFISYSAIDVDENIGLALPTNMKDTIDSSINKAIYLCDKFNGPLVKGYPSLRQIITCSKDLIIEMHKFAEHKDLKLHTHLSEGRYEVDFAIKRYGKRSVEYLSDIGVLDRHLHCAHSVLLTPKEARIFAESGASVVHCPFNNYSIGFPNILSMQELGITVALGTDGVFSAGNTDMMKVGQAFIIGQQSINNVNYNRYPFSFDKIIKMMTIDGARALGIDRLIGSIEIGKKADIISFDTSDISFLPNTANYLSLFGNVVGMNVSMVIVNGSVLIYNHEYVYTDLLNNVLSKIAIVNSIGSRVFNLCSIADTN